MSTTTKARVSREILEDRYQGLVLDDHDGGEWTKLQQRHSSALGDLIAGTARCHRDDVSPILDELFDLVREHIIKRVDELAIAE